MRRRRLGVSPVLVVACALIVAGCSSDDGPGTTSTTTSSTTTVVPGEAVPLDEVELGVFGAVEEVRVGSTTYIVDGLRRIGGDDAQLRIWMLEGPTPTEAVPVDLPDVGGFWPQGLVWFDDHLVVTGHPCGDFHAWYDVREPNADDEPPCTIGESKGFAIDPTTWQVRELEQLTSPPHVAIGLYPSRDGSLLVVAGEPSELLSLSDLDAELERVADAPPNFNICALGDELVVVFRHRTDVPRLLLPLDELYDAVVLRDGAWVPLELPATAYSGTGGEAGGCTDEGLLVSRMVGGGFDDPSEPYAFELSYVDGALAWVPLPPTDAAGHELIHPWAGRGVISDRWVDDGAGTVILRDGAWVQASEIDIYASALLELDADVGSILYRSHRPEDGGAYDPAGIGVFLPPR